MQLTHGVQVDTTPITFEQREQALSNNTTATVDLDLNELSLPTSTFSFEPQGPLEILVSNAPTTTPLGETFFTDTSFALDITSTLGEIAEQLAQPAAEPAPAVEDRISELTRLNRAPSSLEQSLEELLIAAN